MKKSITILAVLALLFSSCSNDDSEIITEETNKFDFLSNLNKNAPAGTMEINNKVKINEGSINEFQFRYHFNNENPNEIILGSNILQPDVWYTISSTDFTAKIQNNFDLDVTLELKDINGEIESNTIKYDVVQGNDFFTINSEPINNHSTQILKVKIALLQNITSNTSYKIEFSGEKSDLKIYKGNGNFSSSLTDGSPLNFLPSEGNDWNDYTPFSQSSNWFTITSESGSVGKVFATITGSNGQVIIKEFTNPNI